MKAVEVEIDILPPPADGLMRIRKVAFDALYLGRQFVIAQWDDGSWWPYWLPSDGAGGSAAPWQANHEYNVNASVQPTTPNGYYYTIGNTEFPQAWQPSKAYAVADVVVPTTLNGWKYTVITAEGANPSSGTTEPVWPTSDGATVTEEHDESSAQTTAPAVPPSNPGGDRYGNLAGGGGIVTGLRGPRVQQEVR